MYRYVFDGAGDEDFPEPPIARTLEPGDEVETDVPVDHPRLRLIAGLDDAKDDEKLAAPDQVQVAQPDHAPLVGPDVTSTSGAPISVEEPSATS